jgi:anion-transporting  ArsA/GET3 family ATPase
MRAFMDKRLVLVMGKGGTGKTTIAAALGLAAARNGKRAVVVEVAEQQRLTSMFGAEPGDGHGEVELAPRLYGLSIHPGRAMEEWLRHQLRSGTLAGLLGGSRIFQLLTAAAPGVSELVTMGKIWDLAQLERRTGGSVFDLAIVDAPATGHGLALLSAPATFARIARSGPVARQARLIDQFTRDPGTTAILAAALPEEMPVTETIELEDRLAADSLALDAIVVNALYPERFDAEEAASLALSGTPAGAESDGHGSPAARAALAAALSEHRRATGQRALVERLREEAGARVVTLPHLFSPELGRAELERLSELLEEAL